ncbi:LysR family transcriptional regulator [Marinobacter hydrocarbonoclasticus]|nr:LysR family transcriptional regulator [Marinobacter nauticus]
MLKQMDLNLLKVFDALMEHQHLTRAAESIHLSQSAMSHALARLRSQLDDTLFVRAQTGMKPTARAQQLAPVIRHALRSLEVGLQPPEPFDPGSSDRTFRLSAIDYFEFLLLPELAGHLQQCAPGVRVQVDLLPAWVPEDALESGEIDAVVSVAGHQNISSRLTRTPWLQERLVGLTSLSSPIAPALSLAEFARVPQVQIDVFSSGFGGLDAWLEAAGIRRNLVMTALSYSVAARVVEKTGYLLCVPERIARILVQMLALRQVRLPAALPQFDIELITHPRFAATPAHQWFIGVLRQVGDQLDGHSPIHSGAD